MDILILLALILLNGMFAMSEIALVTSRKARLAKLAADGDHGAAVAVQLGEDPTRFLSTLQIGITSIGLLNGIVGEATLAAPLAAWFESLGMATKAAGIVSTGLVVITVTYVSIVVGELVPKRIGQINPEGIARLVAQPMNTLSILSRPFVFLLSVSTKALLRLLGLGNRERSAVTEEEIHALLDEGSEAGVIEKSEHAMVRNVFRLDDRHIGSLMVPRSEIVWLDVNRPLEENLARISLSKHARFPVCRGSLEEVLGTISSKQLFAQALKDGMARLALDRYLQPPVYVPESLTCMELLDQFRLTNAHVALVIDEYGDIEGLIALQDILASITGDFLIHREEDAWIVQREDGSLLLDGLLPLPELKDRLGLKSVPEESRGRYNTLSGMIMQLFGRLPNTGDVAVWERWRFEIVDLDGKRIDKVLASHIPGEATALLSEQEASMSGTGSSR